MTKIKNETSQAKNIENTNFLATEMLYTSKNS
jgi:hypothetical protein